MKRRSLETKVLIAVRHHMANNEKEYWQERSTHESQIRKITELIELSRLAENMQKTGHPVFLGIGELNDRLEELSAQILPRRD